MFSVINQKLFYKNFYQKELYNTNEIFIPSKKEEEEIAKMAETQFCHLQMAKTSPRYLKMAEILPCHFCPTVTVFEKSHSHVLVSLTFFLFFPSETEFYLFFSSPFRFNSNWHFFFFNLLKDGISTIYQNNFCFWHLYLMGFAIRLKGLS